MDEEEEAEKHTISNPKSSMDSSPPCRSHSDSKPFSPPAESSAEVSSDRTSHGFFSPREYKNSSPTLEPMSSSVSSGRNSHGFFSPREYKNSSPTLEPMSSSVSSGRTSHGFFSPKVYKNSSPTPEPMSSSVSSERTSYVFFSPRVDKDSFRLPETITSIAPKKSAPSPDTEANQSDSDEPVVEVMKVDPGARTGFNGSRKVEEVRVGAGGGRKARPTLSILGRTRRERMVKMTALGFRVLGFVFCMISFSVMASDKNQGWSLDSFDRYKEFRYCLTVNVIGFIYSGVQACDLVYQLTTKTIVTRQDLRYFFDFFVDQILTYLLISASSSGATRVEDWESNWGKDKFPQVAKASVAMSFLAFVALASSSLISGYTLCTLLSP